MPIIYAQRGRLGEVGSGVTQPADFEAQGVTYTGNRPVMVWFRGDLYIVGMYTRPIVRHATESGTFRIAGIRPPQVQLIVVPGVDTGGSSGGCLAAITFVHKAGARVLAESNFGNVVDVGTLTGQGRVWSQIDNLTAENRVTHVRGYVSMNGDDFRMAWEAPYGLTDKTENVRTAQLSLLGPGDYSHGLVPQTLYAHAAFGRMFYANNPQRPYRLWFSAVGEPQYVGAASFRDTHGREPITGIWKGRNELVVLCLRNSYLVRPPGSPGSSDFVLEQLDSDVGCLTHHAIAEIHNRLWFPSEDGVWIYDGGFKYLMKEIQPLWAADWKDNKASLRDGFMMHDRQNKVYMYVTERQARDEWEQTGLHPGTLAYAGYYGSFEPSMAGNASHPEWTLDLKDRFDSSAFYNTDGELVIGSCDGKIRKQSRENGDDDGDLLGKPCIVRSGHQLFFEPGDELEFGKTLKQLWCYIESEYTAWNLHMRGGDEQAWQGMLSDSNFWYWWTEEPAGESEETRTITGRDGTERTYTVTYTPKVVHWFTPEKVTGRGFTLEIRIVSPIFFEFRGWGGVWGPGSEQRGMDTVTSYDLDVTVAVGAAPAEPYDPRHTLEVDTTGGAVAISIAVDVPSYDYGTAGLPIAVSLTATGVGAWTGQQSITVLDTPTTFIQNMVSGDDWTITITALDANGVSANQSPIYSFQIASTEAVPHASLGELPIAGGSIGE